MKYGKFMPLRKQEDYNTYYFLNVKGENIPYQKMHYDDRRKLNLLYFLCVDFHKDRTIKSKCKEAG